MKSFTVNRLSLLEKVFVFCAFTVICFYFYFGFKGFDLSVFWNSFYQSDFYINYEGGFVRRGLDGQLIFELSKATAWNPVGIQKVYNLILFIIFLAFTGFFIRKYRPPFFVLFSTSVLLLFVFYLGRGIRKDHILLVFFFLACFQLLRKMSLVVRFIILNALFIIASLIHELFFLISFFPIILLLKNLIFNHDREKGYLKSAVLLLPAIIVFIYLLFYGLGNSVQEGIIINSWKNLGVSDLYFNAGIFNRSLYIWELGFTRNQYFSFLLALLLHFVFMIIAITNDLRNKKLIFTFYALIILQYGVLLLLSIVAKDFSRWIFLCNFTSLVPIYLLQKESTVYQTKDSENTFLFLRKLYWIPFILFFINTMPHSGWSFNDYIVYNPLNLVCKIITSKPIF